MSFEDILKDAIEQSGGFASVIMGKDGIAVRSYTSEDCPFNVEDIAIEYNNILKMAKEICDSHKMGEIKELFLSTNSSNIVFRSINEDYFMALAVNNDTYLGKARFALRIAVDKAKKEF